MSLVEQQKTNISFEKISHRGRSGLDELVPSRYALQIGEIDVLVISDGVVTRPNSPSSTPSPRRITRP
jgi:hypothetical protein